MLRTSLPGLLLAVLLLAPAVVVVTPGVAAGDEPTGAVVLAAEEGADEDAPLPGPEPQLGEDSPFGPPEYEVPWTYGMGILLSAVAVLAIVGTAAGYWFLVRRPERESAEG